MRDVLRELVAWWREDVPVGMATVVRTWRSSPRQPGATMLVGAAIAVTLFVLFGLSWLERRLGLK